jgi:uncharacterized protein YbjT (DUF2867 family)
MHMDGTVTIIGGAGRIGRLVTGRLLADQAHVRAASRAAREATDLADRGVALYNADIRSADSLRPALDGATVVMVSIEPGAASSGSDRPETTMYTGVKNVLAGCPASLRRFVLLSQIYVTRPDHPMNSGGRLLDWRLRGEDAVRESGLPYTIVRPSWNTLARVAGPAVVLEQGDRGDGKIAVGDVAEACVRAMTSPAAAGKTFELYNGPGQQDTDWESLLTALRPDRVPQY